MSNLSTYSRNLLLNFQTTNNAVTRPTAWYVGVGTGHTTSGLTGEPSGNGYARQAATFTVSSNTSTTAGLVTFGPATASWGSMASIALFDAATGGNCLWVGSLSAAKTVDAGDSLTVNAGAFTLTLT